MPDQQTVVLSPNDKKVITPAVPAGWSGSVEVQTTGGALQLAIVVRAAQSGGNDLGAYNAYGSNTWDANFYVPLVRKAEQFQTTIWKVYNPAILMNLQKVALLFYCSLFSWKNTEVIVKKLIFFLIFVLFLSYGCASQQNSIIKLKDQGICQEINSGKMWQIDKGGRFSSLDEAERYAASLKLGGYNDWRVPTRDEYFHLHYIFLSGKNNDCAMNLKGEFWSVPQGKEPTIGHWETYFQCGAELKYVESQKLEGYVRAVRP